MRDSAGFPSNFAFAFLRCTQRNRSWSCCPSKVAWRPLLTFASLLSHHCASGGLLMATPSMMKCWWSESERRVGFIDDEDVYHYIGERLKLERETENMCVWAKMFPGTKVSYIGERPKLEGKTEVRRSGRGMTAEVLRATPWCLPDVWKCGCLCWCGAEVEALKVRAALLWPAACAPTPRWLPRRWPRTWPRLRPAPTAASRAWQRHTRARPCAVDYYVSDDDDVYYYNC